MFTHALEQKYFEALERRLQSNPFEAMLGSQTHLNGRDTEALRKRFDDSVLDPPYKDLDEFVNVFFGDLIEGIAAAPKSVLFVSLVPYFVQLKLAKMLERHGYRVFVLSVQPVVDHIKRMFCESFGDVYNTGGSYQVLQTLLEKISPTIAYVQCWMWHYNVGRLVLDHCSAEHRVCDFYDITSVFAEPDKLQVAFDRGQIDMDHYLERYILKNADVVVSRYAEPTNRQWTRSHGVDRPILRFNAYPVSDYVSLKAIKRPKSPYRLVYAGGLIPSNLPPGLFPEAFMWNMFEVICAQGIEVDVLHDPHRALMDDEAVYGPYVALAEREPKFRMRDGVTPDLLAQVLQQYDFGILLADFSQARSELTWAQRSGVFATKLLSYIEAGLPIIVNAEYSAMAKFVDRFNIGVAVTTEEVGALHDIISVLDYREMQRAIRSYLANNCMAVMIHDLFDAMGDIS